MAVDKLVDSTQLNADLTSVANAIRTKGGTSAQLAFPAGFVNAIGDLPSGGGSANVEFGTFTLTEVQKTYTIVHTLGVVPNFCIVYPVNIPKQDTTYKIGYEVIMRDMGQQDWNITTTSDTYGSVHVFGNGTGYAANTPGSIAGNNKGITIQGVDYAGVATTTTFVVGGHDNTSSSCSLVAGTYGYILGVVPAS